MVREGQRDEEMVRGADKWKQKVPEKEENVKKQVQEKLKNMVKNKLSDEAQKGQKRSSAPERQGPAQRKNIANVWGVKSCNKWERTRS